MTGVSIPGYTVRPIRFIAVGGLCFLVQVTVLDLLLLVPVNPGLANAVGFALSAQLNFILSYTYTWGDRRRVRAPDIRVIWSKYNLNVGGALLVNTLTFMASSQLVPLIVAVLVANAASAVVTYSVNHYLVFQPLKDSSLMDAQNAGTTLPDFKGGIAVFMPAWNEESNLKIVVESMITYLQRCKSPFMVIIVNDGSTDETIREAWRLQMKYTDVVDVRVHPVNLGYGAALRTGMYAGLETGFQYIAFCDADGQFRPDSLGRLKRAMDGADADLAIGYRISRADSFSRRLMGRGWHLLTSRMLGFDAKDVDCGFKLFRRDVVKSILPVLAGECALISPAILAVAHRMRYVMVETGLDHFPRLSGKQSGANARVVVRSLLGLKALNSRLDEERLIR